MSEKMFRSSPAEIAARFARNPKLLLRTPERLADVFKWRRINQKIDELDQTRGGVSFIQIGANDGMRGDPIHDRVIAKGWQGVVIEPIPEHFAELGHTYANIPGIKLIQAAVAATNGSVDMFRIRHEQLRGAGIESHSMYPDIAERSLGMLGVKEALAAATETITVPAITFRDAVKSLEPMSPDIVISDTEGADEMIMKSLLASDVRPGMILYEHLFMDPQSQADLLSTFQQEGYSNVVCSQDTFLYKS